MAKKLNLDNAIKKAENISSKVDIIMRNRLIIAFFLVVDGITFILNPDTTLPEMAKNIILIMLLATVSVLIANLSAKTKDKKTIAISIIIIALGIFFYFYPDLISAYMQLLLALFIIYEGVTNIANALNLDKLSGYTQKLAQKYHKITSQKPTSGKKAANSQKFKEVDDNINEELKQQEKKLITPLKNIIGKTSGSSTLYVIANAASIILGIVLLIYPGASMTVWGIIFLYTGIPNLLAAVRTMNLPSKLKEKKFKEILFDTEQETKTKKNSQPSQKNKSDQ